MCQVTPTKEVTVSTYGSLYKNSPQTLQNATSISSSSHTFGDKDPHTYPSLTFSFSVGDDVVWVYGVDESVLRDGDLAAANYNLSNCGSGGGGGVIETVWTTVAVGAYAVLLTDYQIRVTVLSTLTLPTILSASIGRVYRIFSRNVKVTINTSGGDLINNNASIVLNKWESVTLRASAAGDWAIGD